jgi:bifunctional non-homologous end joining protein LigD
MLLLRTDTLPSGPTVAFELKLDGFRAEAIKSRGKNHLRSRNDKDFNSRYPAIVKALAAMPDETVIDGEIVALASDGRPSFNAFQNYGGATAIVYYVFDLMILEGRDIMDQPLESRRELLGKRVLAALDEPIRESPELQASLPDLVHSVKAQGLEGLVAKRRDSRYARPALRRMAEDARQSRPGVCHRRLHAGSQELRRAHLWLLSRRRSTIRRPHEGRLHPGGSRSAVQTLPRPGKRRVPIRESARAEERPVGGRADGRENEGQQVASSAVGRAV